MNNLQIISDAISVHVAEYGEPESRGLLCLSFCSGAYGYVRYPTRNCNGYIACFDGQALHDCTDLAECFDWLCAMEHATQLNMDSTANLRFVA